MPTRYNDRPDDAFEGQWPDGDPVDLQQFCIFAATAVCSTTGLEQA